MYKFFAVLIFALVEFILIFFKKKNLLSDICEFLNYATKSSWQYPGIFCYKIHSTCNPENPKA